MSQDISHSELVFMYLKCVQIANKHKLRVSNSLDNGVFRVYADTEVIYTTESVCELDTFLFNYDENHSKPEIKRMPYND